MASELRTPLTQSTGSSFLKACFNTTNAFLGIGLLTVPYALSSGGWLSLLLFFLVAAITFYTGLLLKTCLDADPSIRSYLDISERAFGKRGRLIVSIIMSSELYLVAIGLLILEGDNLHKLFPKFLIKIGTLTIHGLQSFIMITALVISPSMLLTDLGILSYVSATGVFSCLIILVSVICVGAINGVGFNAKGKLLNVGGIPTAVSLYIVCFAGHPVVPSVYTSMRDPYQFSKPSERLPGPPPSGLGANVVVPLCRFHPPAYSKSSGCPLRRASGWSKAVHSSSTPTVLFSGFTVTTVTYLSMAIVGYLMYGDTVESAITLNLPTGKASAEVAIYTTLLIPITRYALMLTPVANGIESGLSENYKNRRSFKILIRMALLLSTVVLACAFPHFESLMAIVGSIFIVLVSFILPCLFYLKIYDSYHQGWSYKTIGSIGIIIFGTLAGIFGTWFSIAQLVDDT